jgi:ribonuclease HI
MAKVAQPPVITPDENSLTVFTDGSMLPRPRRGGIGIRFVRTDDVGNETVFDHLEPGHTGATNNQMELKAVIVALRLIDGGRLPAGMLDNLRKIDIITDSHYVADNLRNALFEWPNNKWNRHTGAPVLNVDLWKDLTREYKKMARLNRLELKWGKGHSGSNPHNRVADKLAKQSAREANRVLNPSLTVRRKKTDKVVEPGSVPMLGQRLTIRIISTDYLRAHRLYRHRYEVMSKKSLYRGNVDFAVSSEPRIAPNHTYYVTMNRDSNNPRIVKLIREVES